MFPNVVEFIENIFVAELIPIFVPLFISSASIVKAPIVPSVALIFLTAIIGIYFAKLQGIQTLKSGMVNLYQNKIPIYEIVSGASIAIAALLLIIPGFFSDLIGFLLLMPFTRKIIFSLVLKNKPQAKMNSEDETIDGEIVDHKKDEL